jgi:GT2 family glycosyltransferase
MTDEKVIVVTVNWNRYGDTCACLDSLIAQEGVQVDLIVVDNGSTDNSETRLREKYPQLRICKSEKILDLREALIWGSGRHSTLMLIAS